MARFCSWCGKSLESGARFCSQCGSRVIESVIVTGSVEPADPMRGLDIVDGVPISAGETVKLKNGRSPADTIETMVLSTDDEPKKFTTEKNGRSFADAVETVVLSIDDEPKKFTAEEPKESKKPKKGRKALITCIVIIVVLLAVIAALIFMQIGDDLLQVGQAAEQADIVESAQDDATTLEEEDSSEEESAVLSDDEAFDLLDSAYARLESYDERVDSCISNFNTLFLSASLSQRETAMEEAEALLDELQAELETLEAIVLSDTSPYVDDLENMVELYVCQIGRLEPIVEAWALDVTFDDPSGHTDEILEVVAQNNENGTNKYFTRFNELYPEAAPQRES